MQERSRKTLEERFWGKVEKLGEKDCWPWIASVDEHGYGQIGATRYNKRKLAHRLSWEIHFGEIPENTEVLHKCDNPSCVNPEHLFLGTQLDNMRDMINKGRRGYTGRDELGTANPYAKLNDDLVRYIRIQRELGRSQQSIADEIGVDRKTVGCVDIGKTWSHVQ